MSPYLMQVLRGVAVGRNAIRHAVLADMRYPVWNLPEVQAEYWRSVRADDAAEYRAEVEAAASYLPITLAALAVECA